MKKKTPKKKKAAKPRKRLPCWLVRSVHTPEWYLVFTQVRPPRKSVNGGWVIGTLPLQICAERFHAMLPARSKYRLKPGGGPVKLELKE